MNKVIFIISLLMLSCLAGCAALDRTIPINPDTGFREPTDITSEVMNAIPYGPAGLAALLFASNAFLLFKKKKTDAGLASTIKAIEAASKDPEMADMITKLKTKLASAHKEVDVQPLINRVLAKIKFNI
jgi:hypothetical protein